jgi:L-iditol 2-dehydrogenase
MKALVKTQKGPGNLEYIDFPEPQPGPGEVKIQVKACGICGTDLHIWHDEFKNFPPVVLGHEFSGVIVELGEGVEGIAVNQRVTTEVMFQTCGHCRACKTGYYNLCLTRRGLGWAANGAFAPYTIIEAKYIHPIPDNISFEEAALSEPLAVSTYAVSELTGVAAGDLVLVTGPGPIGLLTAQIALSEGARVIMAGTTSDTDRLNLAKELGVHATVNVEEQDAVALSQQWGDELGADIVFECSGAAPAASLALNAVRKGGKYMQVGLYGRPIEINFDLVTMKEIELFGVFSSNWRGWNRGLKLARFGKVKLQPLISHVFPLSKWRTAFDLAESKQGLKILLTPEDD